jgi:hypothetical protein
MYTSNIIWQLSNFLKLIKHLILETLSLTNQFIMSSYNDITSNLASAFVSLNSYLDTVNRTLDSTTAVEETLHTFTSTPASPTSTTSSD